MTWKRTPLTYQTEIAQDELRVEDVIMWLRRQRHTYLLAHADDGVIWGRWDGDNLLTSGEIIPPDYADVCPPLRAETLQQARLFSENRETLIWRDGAGWRSRTITDGTGNETLTGFDEYQLLWGDYSIALDANFTLLEDGQQGLRHAVPIMVDFSRTPGPVKLKARHYLHADDKTGVNHIAYSRLVGIEVENE